MYINESLDSIGNYFIATRQGQDAMFERKQSMRHSYLLYSTVCLSASFVGCNGSTRERDTRSTSPSTEQLPLVVLRAPDLRLGGLQFRHRISGPAIAFSSDGKTL